MSSRSDSDQDDNIVTEVYGPRLNHENEEATPFDKNDNTHSSEPLDEEGILDEDDINEDVELLKMTWMNELVRVRAQFICSYDSSN